MGSSYMAASGLSPDGQVRADSDFFAPAMENADVFISHFPWSFTLERPGVWGQLAAP